MPELPEVETIRRGLEPILVGRQIMDVIVLNEKSFHGSTNDVVQFLVEATIKNVRRRAKVLMIDLSTDYSLVIHLKMTGQIVVRGANNWAGGHPNESFVEDLPNKSTRIYLTFDDGAKLFFNDQRKFGWIKLIPTITIDELAFISKLGPEPLIGNPAEEFLTRVRRRNNTTIKAAILDQSVIAGIGNIYADEALWLAKIHPETRVRDLTDSQLASILKGAIEAMTKSIESGGSTMQNYIKADGSRGNYLDLFANVFRREGLACPRCGATIEKIRVAGRGTHICPNCQRAPDN